MVTEKTYLNLPQLGPFGLISTERADAVDLGCLWHCEGARGAGRSGQCTVQMV